MSAGDIAIIIGASVQAASVILGLGKIQGCIKDIRDDMRETRTSLQSFLLTQVSLLNRRSDTPRPDPEKSP
jgi:hypothetical protein